MCEKKEYVCVSFDAAKVSAFSFSRKIKRLILDEFSTFLYELLPELVPHEVKGNYFVEFRRLFMAFELLAVQKT